MTRKLISSGTRIGSFVLLFISTTICANEHSSAPLPDRSAQVVEYPAVFFQIYQPNTAMDMVRQIPGFLVDDGDITRGFAGTAGNILINSRRPSAKQDRPSAILSRIPATQVIRIEMIRGQVRGIDLRGQSAVVNVVLLDDASAAIRWESFVLYSSTGPLKPGIKASLSDRWKSIEYNIGIGIERDANGENGPEYVLNNESQLTENRFDKQKETGFNLSGLFINASSWLGETFFQVNSKFGLVNAPEVTQSNRIPLSGSATNILLKDAQHIETYELGLDAERRLADDLSGKAIFIYINRLDDVTSTQFTRNLAGSQLLFRQADTVTDLKEGIARLEFDWTGLANHAIQLNLEGAYNVLEGTLLQVEDRGLGSIVVDVPGGNTIVEEYRGDFLLKDTWSLGKFELDYGLGAEVSTISQSGEDDLERNFFFLVPQMAVSYASGQGEQTRLRLAREIAQLNFKDFVSATVFEDDDLALGNPNLSPDKTWMTELIHERRFGGISVVKVTAFHHWITDVLDLLPLTSTFAVPGNIGDGRRWGIELESTVPLEWLGLRGSRIDVKLRWQDSTVVDPVTGENRVLSANSGFSGPPNIRFREENRYVFDLGYRQDLEAERVAWGWRLAEQAERPLFKVNESDFYNEGLLVNVFIETTRWFGLKARIEGNNLLNYDEIRERTFFMEGRDISPVTSSILRKRRAGRRLNMVFSGRF